MYRILVICIIVINLFFAAESNETLDQQGTKLQYPDYPYMKISHLDHKYRVRSNKCEYQTDCVKHEGLERKNCINECISKICYDKIYAPNSLEEGEIDQRSQSFRGCFNKYSKSSPDF